MASQKNIVTSLRIIVHCYSYSAYHQNDTLKHLPRNCHLTLLRPRRLQISKILSHASESSLLSSYLVLSIIVTFWSFYGEIFAEPYYCPKHCQFENTVRHLKIILLSLFFLLVIRASIWSPFGNNLAEPRQDQKYDQFAKYCYTPLNIRIHLVFWWISSQRHFGTLTLKFLLNPITKETMTNLQNTVKRLGNIVFSNLQFLISKSRRTPFWPKIWPICITLSQVFYSPFSAGLFVRIM